MISLIRLLALGSKRELHLAGSLMVEFMLLFLWRSDDIDSAVLRLIWRSGAEAFELHRVS